MPHWPSKFATASATPVANALDRFTHAKLHVTLDVADGRDNAATTVARLTIAGDLDAMHIDANTRMAGDWDKPAAADVQANATIDAGDGAALIKLVGLDRIAAAGKGRGQLKLNIAGPADGTMSGAMRLASGGLSVNSQVAIAGLKIALDDIDAKVGSSAVRGRLAVNVASPLRIDGALDTDTVNAENLIAGAIGMPSSVAASRGGWSWSSEPFAGGALGDFVGQVALKAQRVNVTPRLAAREFRAAMRLSKDAIAFDDLTAEIAGGRLAGRLGVPLDRHGLERASQDDADRRRCCRSAARRDAPARHRFD